MHTQETLAAMPTVTTEQINRFREAAIAIEQQNAELKEQSSRLAAEAVRQAKHNAVFCVKNAELIASMKAAANWIRNGFHPFDAVRALDKAIAKAGGGA